MITSKDNDDESKVEYLTTKVSRQFVWGRRAVIYTVQHLADRHVDVWVNACLEFMGECVQVGQPLLVLQDLSSMQVYQTDYSQQRGNEVTHAFPELQGRIAFVLPDTLASRRIRHFVHSQKLDSRERQVFFDRQEALEWLMDGLA